MADQQQHHPNYSTNQNVGGGPSRLSNQRPSFKKNPHTASGKILRTDQDTKVNEQTRQLFRLAQGEIDELKDSLRYAEYALARTKQEKEVLERQMEEEHEETIKTKVDLKMKENERDLMARQADALAKQAEHAQMTQTKVQSEAQKKLFQLQNEINSRENEINKLSLNLREKDASLTKLVVTEKINRVENKEYRDLLQRKDQSIKQLQLELEDAKRKLDEIVMTRKSEGTALLEIHHYKADNERLIAMLSQTKEFENFGKLASDSVSDGGVGIRYMNPNPSNNSQPICHYPKQKSNLKDFYTDKNECEDWIPDEAFKLAHDFRNKCASNISQSLMNQLLQDLNKVWRQREKKQIHKVQNQSNKEIAYLRRQISFRQPYDQVMAENDIKRLKKEVKDQNQALRENVAVIKESSEAPLQGLVLVDQTVKYTNQIQQERRQLQDENERLKKRIEDLERSQKDEDNEREKFYDGAAWLGKQVVEECEKGLSKVSQSLRKEYQKKIDDCGRDDFLKSRVHDWLIDSSERVVKDVRDNNRNLLENALRNKNVVQKLNAYTKLTHLYNSNQ
ncbi:UNKNOWN [Stylonychia lemnae]|uniref:Uncharacterized protein n=1 Tax=Stylonychia lemnae TaxID=5949 RepID=A0A078ANS8_STYLE|nr:UNKNOWN [Stylonychia lemnae]|eukprot:CDW83586.1 UNKNOWN [Stylonychia lemnae]